ncbi:hypothetical protein C0992_004066 [Termitomyces sp. T32_za158]|nr:hypothetical protein C0992_004066 [Termitomyces sp. T32_za158]
MWSHCLIVTAAILTHRVLAIVVGPVADLPIVNAVIAPDGFNRRGVLAQGTFPGPIITGNKGDTFQLNVVNELTDVTMLKSTSIHWHGLFQKGTAWADGPSFVTQCPIAPGDSFLYTFSSADQAGTFWYHSHLSTQYCDGLRGVFVIYDPNDPHKDLYDVDDVIEVDGVNHEPLLVDSIQIYAGQRYSFVVRLLSSLFPIPTTYVSIS